MIRKFGTVAALITIAAGCGSSDDSIPATFADTTSVSPPTTATATTAAATTTAAPTTAAAPTTQVATTSPPSTATPGTAVAPAAGQPTDAQFEQILEALYVRNNALYADPPTADVASVCALGSDCESQSQEAVTNMTAAGQRIVGLPPTDIVSIDSVTDLSTEAGSPFAPGDAFQISFTTTDPGEDLGDIVDAEGNVEFDLVPPEDRIHDTRIIIRTLTDPELPWRFTD